MNMNWPRKTQAERGNLYQVIWGPQRFYLSIGWKTLIAFLLIVVLPMFSLSVITTALLRSTLEAGMSHTLEGKLRGAWHVYNERPTQLRAVLTQTAADPVVQAGMRAKTRSVLDSMFQHQASLLPYTSVWLALDKNRTLLAQYSDDIRAADIEPAIGELLTRAYRSGEISASGSVVTNALFLERQSTSHPNNLGQMLLAQVVVVPVIKKKTVIGTLVGVILLNHNHWLPSILHKYLNVDAAVFLSTGPSTRAIATTKRTNNLWLAGMSAPEEIRDALRRNTTFHGKLRLNNEPSFVIADPIDNIDHHPIGALAIGIQTNRIDTLIAQNTTNIYLFMGLGVALALLIAYLAYRDTITPMRALTWAMDDFARGELGVRTELLTKDEFEELGQGFNRMADAIQKHEERINKYNALSKLLITTLNPKDLLQRALDKVSELTGSAAGIIYLFSEDTGLLEPYVAYGLDLAVLDTLKQGQGVPGQVAQQKARMHIKEIPPTCNIIIHFGVATAAPAEVAAFPLMLKDKLQGVLLLATISHFRTGELPFIEYMTDQISIVLDNALIHENIERLSITDSLTNLYNRRHIAKRMEIEFSRAFRYEHPLSLLIMDIDYFKQVNDTFGHLVGDDALIMVAHIIRQSVRDSDLCARYGGEEFVVILPHTNREQANVVAQKIRQAVAAAVVPGMENKQLTLSIGVATYPDSQALSLEELIRKADKALYRAKEAGRNQVILG